MATTLTYKVSYCKHKSHPLSLGLLPAESRRSAQSIAGKALAIPSPHAERAVRGGSDKNVVGRQQRRLVTNAKLREQGVDGANLTDPLAIKELYDFLAINYSGHVMPHLNKSS